MSRAGASPFWSVRAKTTMVSATLPPVMNVFDPFITYVSPRLIARVRMPPASDPEPGSVSAKAAICSPRASGGKYLRFWSSLPASQMGRLPSDWTLRIKDEVAQNLLISSTATISVSALPLTPPNSGVNGMARMSCFANNSLMSQGNSPDSSICAARGSTRSRQMSWTISRISRCSSLSAKSIRRAPARGR